MLYTSDNIFILYYLKLSANSPKGYLPATDVNQNSDTTRYCGNCVSN